MIKLDVRKFLHGRPRMLMRDLFAVTSILVIITGGHETREYIVSLRLFCLKNKNRQNLRNTRNQKHHLEGNALLAVCKAKC